MVVSLELSHSYPSHIFPIAFLMPEFDSIISFCKATLATFQCGIIKKSSSNHYDIAVSETLPWPLFFFHRGVIATFIIYSMLMNNFKFLASMVTTV